MTTLETISWRGVHSEMPEAATDGRFVLVYGPRLKGAGGERTWIASHQGGWIAASGACLENVTHWAPMPTGAD